MAARSTRAYRPAARGRWPSARDDHPDAHVAGQREDQRGGGGAHARGPAARRTRRSRCGRCRRRSSPPPRLMSHLSANGRDERPRRACSRRGGDARREQDSPEPAAAAIHTKPGPSQRRRCRPTGAWRDLGEPLGASGRRRGTSPDRPRGRPDTSGRGRQRPQRQAVEVEAGHAARHQVGDDARGAARHRPAHVAVAAVEEQVAVAGRGRGSAGRRASSAAGTRGTRRGRSRPRRGTGRARIAGCC